MGMRRDDEYSVLSTTEMEGQRDEQPAVEYLVIDYAGHEALFRGQRLPLTHKEFVLLRLLVENRGRVFTRDELIERIWENRELKTHRTVDICVHRLRAKLGPPFDTLIQTVRHVGYKMRAAPGRPPIWGETLSSAS
jgi:DNA-binding response OmpR family regulator